MIKLKAVQFIHAVRVDKKSEQYIDVDGKKHQHVKMLALLPEKECVVFATEGGDCKLIPMHVNIRSMTPAEVPQLEDKYKMVTAKQAHKVLDDELGKEAKELLEKVEKANAKAKADLIKPKKKRGRPKKSKSP